MRPLWKVVPAEGTALATALIELEEQGYEPFQIIHYATEPVHHPLNPDKVALVPRFVVAARSTGTPMILMPTEEELVD